MDGCRTPAYLIGVHANFRSPIPNIDHISKEVLYLLPLSSRAKLRKRELSRKRDDFALVLPCDWLWSPQGEEPLGIGELPEVELWTAKKRLQTAGILHFGNLL